MRLFGWFSNIVKWWSWIQSNHYGRRNELSKWLKNSARISTFDRSEKIVLNFTTKMSDFERDKIALLTWLSINLVKRQFRELWKSLALSYEIGIFFNFQFLMSQCKNFNWLQPFFKMCTWTHCTESSHFVHNVNLHRSDMNDLRSFEVIRGRCIQ